MNENVFEDRALQKYLKEISKIDPLDPVEENRLILLAKEGDKEAMNKILTSNLKFVVKIAAHYQNRGLSLAELISEGNTGLIKALQKFDPTKDNKLISYAVWWIKQRILFALAEKTSLVRMPLGKANMSNKIKQARERIHNITGEKATIKEIAEYTKINERAVKKSDKQAINMLSLSDRTYTRKHEVVEYTDFLEDPNSEDPKKLYYRQKVNDSIEKSIEKLPSREAYIIKEYFGLNGQKGKNFAQIAETLGLSRERVRQIQKKALQKIYAETYKEEENDIDYLINSSL